MYLLKQKILPLSHSFLPGSLNNCYFLIKYVANLLLNDVQHYSYLLLTSFVHYEVFKLTVLRITDPKIYFVVLSHRCHTRAIEVLESLYLRHILFFLLLNDHSILCLLIILLILRLSRVHMIFI